MTNEEAVLIAGILKTADGGCTNCAYALAEAFEKYFPGLKWKQLVRDKAIAELWPDD